MGATARLRGSRGAPSTIQTRRLDDPRRRDQAPPFGVVVLHGKRPVRGGAARLRLRDRPEAEMVPGRPSSALRPAAVQAPPRGRQGGEGGQCEGSREEDGALLDHGYHPTQKPLRLVRRAIAASSREGDLVFDPFCGSGTTGVAAKELGRFFVGAEKEEEYAELAARRIGAAVRGGVLGELSGGENA